MVAPAGAVVGRPRRLIVTTAAMLGCSAAMVVGVVVVAMGGAAPPAQGVAGGSVPPLALHAYQRAAASPLGVACGLRWQVLAAVARVESNHAVGRSVTPEGVVSPAIIGPALDGTGGFAVVADTDGGRLDGDATWDHAVGPLQFLPSTWAAYGLDASGDGLVDPHNLYDAAAGAAAKLCAGGRLDDGDALRAALFAYNRSDAYVGAVLGWITAYDHGPAAAGTTPEATGTLVEVRGIVVDAALAGGLEALLEAAAADGVVLSGSGHRTYHDQVALRRAHCGTSSYAVFEMPSHACSPPTARPGQSQHEAGLAVDFTCAGALVTRTSRCFAWLAANAAHYGLRNLPSEAWHWSTTGR